MAYKIKLWFEARDGTSSYTEKNTSPHYYDGFSRISSINSYVKDTKGNFYR